MHNPAELEQLIERQMSTWDSQKRLREHAGQRVRGERRPRSGGPWVTVSLQLGSGGAELAAAVAARLGWHVFNKELLQAIASRMHVRERVLSRLDGHATGALQDYLDHLFVPDHPGRPAYLKELLGVLWTVAREGQAVIVGRGANWLLDPNDGLRLRVIAPAEMRAQWLARTEKLSAADAHHRINEDDADRAAFIRQAFKKDIDDALGYDLVINRGVLEHEAAVESVVVALGRKLEHRTELQQAF
jgi:cytidylate kinase